MGSANVSMSDPPSDPEFENVWVTVDGVSASVSSTGDSGWVNLVSGLDSTAGSITAVQLDLENLPESGKCLLAQLGSTSSLPVGDYQQIRLQLVPNNATGVTLIPYSGELTEPQNQCTNAWNCVMPKNGALTVLDLSSQAQTGLKIPPGQILGGPISVAAGKSVDINIDFNAGRSIVAEGNGQYRLDPVLVAYQTSQNLSGISGQVVQGTGTSALTLTTNPVPGAHVALELDPNSNPTIGSSAVDLIGNYLTTADTNGDFDFCPLPSGNTFDIVANAGTSSSATGSYNATIVTGVPPSMQPSTGVPEGTAVTVPLLAEAGGPGTLTGSVTATPASSTATSITANIYALQTATSTLDFADPLLTVSTPALAQIPVPCTSGSCSATYTLVVPASDPVVGKYSTSGITWSLPTNTTSGSYNVEATCSTSSGTASVFTTASQSVSPAGSTTVTPDLDQLQNCE